MVNPYTESSGDWEIRTAIITFIKSRQQLSLLHCSVHWLLTQGVLICSVIFENVLFIATVFLKAAKMILLCFY